MQACVPFTGCTDDEEEEEKKKREKFVCSFRGSFQSWKQPRDWESAASLHLICLLIVAVYLSHVAVSPTWTGCCARCVDFRDVSV